MYDKTATKFILHTIKLYARRVPRILCFIVSGNDRERFALGILMTDFAKVAFI